MAGFPTSLFHFNVRIGEQEPESVRQQVLPCTHGPLLDRAFQSSNMLLRWLSQIPEGARPLGGVRDSSIDGVCLARQRAGIGVVACGPFSRALGKVFS